MEAELTRNNTVYDRSTVDNQRIDGRFVPQTYAGEETYRTTTLPERYWHEEIDSDPVQYGPVFEALPGHCNIMGVSVEANGCNATMIAGADVDFIDVCRYDKDDPNQPLERWRLTTKSETDNAFYGFIPGMQQGDLYGVRAFGKWDPNNPQNPTRVNPHKLAIDLHAKAITGEYKAVDENGKLNPQVTENLDWHRHYSDNMNKADSAPFVPRCVVVDNNSYDWGDDRKPDIPNSKVVVYEAHVKDMTMSHPEVPEHQRGTYAGMASPPMIEHYKRLGITTLELMPVQHFVTDAPIQERGRPNHWGYQTLGFFAPHAGYSSSGENGEQVTEFKDMVAELHKANIEVVLDVVYNHTPEGNEEGPTLGAKAVIDREFYHRNEYTGLHNDDSGCGNTCDASGEIGQQLILDSLRYWAVDMHVDGFRFDLAPILARVSPSGLIDMDGSPFMKALDEAPELGKLYAEPWDIRENRIGQFSPRWNGGEWSGTFRDVVRAFFCEKPEARVGSLSTVLAGGYIANQAVNFVTAHDGFTLEDLVSYDYKHNDANGEYNADGENNNRSSNFGHEGPTDDPEILARRNRVKKAMLATMFLSAGIPMISHGDEIGRTQGGNNNTYCQDNEISWLNWDLSDDQKNLRDYVANLIKFRKAHQLFERPNIDWFRHNGERFDSGSSAWDHDPVLGMHLSGEALPEMSKNTDSLLVYSSGVRRDLIVQLPKESRYTGPYERVIDSSTGFVKVDARSEMTIVENEIILPGLSVAAFRRVHQRS